MSFYRSSVLLLGLLCVTFLTSCSEQEASHDYFDGITSESSGVANREAPVPADASSVSSPSENEPQRWIAQRFYFQVQTESENLESTWKQLERLCAEKDCDIITSVFNNDQGSPSAQITFRILPSQLSSMESILNQHTKILHQSSSSEDKTSQMIDTQARIQNRIELRNRLRTMLQKTSGNLSEILEVERTLADVQSELDAYEQSRALILAETQKNWVQIELIAKRKFVEPRDVSPLTYAWRNISYTISTSSANLLIFIASVLPWTILLVVIYWIIKKVLRSARKRTAQSAKPD